MNADYRAIGRLLVQLGALVGFMLGVLVERSFHWPLWITAVTWLVLVCAALMACIYSLPVETPAERMARHPHQD